MISYLRSRIRWECAGKVCWYNINTTIKTSSYASVYLINFELDVMRFIMHILRCKRAIKTSIIYLFLFDDTVTLYLDLLAIRNLDCVFQFLHWFIIFFVIHLPLSFLFVDIDTWVDWLLLSPKLSSIINIIQRISSTSQKL